MLSFVIAPKTSEPCSHIETLLLDRSLMVRKQMADLFKKANLIKHSSEGSDHNNKVFI